MPPHSSFTACRPPFWWNWRWKARSCLADYLWWGKHRNYTIRKLPTVSTCSATRVQLFACFLLISRFFLLTSHFLLLTAHINRYFGPLPPSRGVHLGPNTSVALQSTQLGAFTLSSSPTRSYTPAGQT